MTTKHKSIEEAIKEFETQFGLIDSEIATQENPTPLQSFLNEQIEKAYEAGKKDERGRTVRKIEEFASHPLIHREMFQALEAIKSALSKDTNPQDSNYSAKDAN